MRGKLLGSTAPPPEIKSKKPATAKQYGSPPPAYVTSYADAAAPATAVQLLPHQRQGDRGSADDAAGHGLRRYVRFNDLVAAGIVTNWATLARLQDQEGFPLGVMLGKNTRVWPVDEVENWVARRPVARKVPGNVIKARERKRATVEVSVTP